MTDRFRKSSSLMPAAMLARPKLILMETEMSVQALTSAGGTREQVRFARSVAAALVHRINEHRKDFFAQILAALKETRRREAARIIHRYRDLID